MRTRRSSEALICRNCAILAFFGYLFWLQCGDLASSSVDDCCSSRGAVGCLVRGCVLAAAALTHSFVAQHPCWLPRSWMCACCCCSVAQHPWRCRLPRSRMCLAAVENLVDSNLQCQTCHANPEAPWITGARLRHTPRSCRPPSRCTRRRLQFEHCSPHEAGSGGHYPQHDGAGPEVQQERRVAAFEIARVLCCLFISAFSVISEMCKP